MRRWLPLLVVVAIVALFSRALHAEPVDDQVSALVAVAAAVFRLSVPWLFASAAFSAVLIAFVVWSISRIQSRPVVSGREHMIGSVAVAVRSFTSRGPVRIHGEVWDAQTDAPLVEGERARVVDVRDLVLRVHPLTPIGTALEGAS